MPNDVDEHKKEKNDREPDTPMVKPDAPLMLYNPIPSMSAQMKVLIPSLIAVSTALSALVATSVRNQGGAGFFTITEMSAGQILISCMVFTFTLWYAGFVAVSVRRMLTQGEDWATATGFYLSADAQSHLRYAAEFSCYMVLFFLCDRTRLLGRAEKHYSKDLFWSLWVMLVFAAFFSLRKAKRPPPPSTPTKAVEGSLNSKQTDASPTKVVAVPTPDAEEEEEPFYHVKLLQRDQTEEWKGWMQIMFLWYHYFNAKDIYNAIRLYIAAYVWMTGFGNFSYYYIRRDFSLGRFLQMQWRLNFFVAFVCLTLENEYMLYYICMLHTTFTVFIYGGLGIMHHINQTFTGISIKFGAMLAASLIIWEIPGVFDIVWKPLEPLVQYHDPYKPTRPIMHEWFFRSHLDYLIWIVGMLFAYNHPRMDAYLETLDRMPPVKGHAIKAGIASVGLAVGYWYVNTVFLLPKKEYIPLHPYTSWIPIALYILFRNLWGTFRQYHLHLFEYLGKITLETYIAQFHIWMATTGVNGAPKKLLRILPEKWPIMNFLLISAIYIWVSLRLFHCTNGLKQFVLPSGKHITNQLLRRNALLLVGLMCAGYAYASVLRLLAVKYASLPAQA